MKPIAISIPTPQHAPTIRAPKPIPKPPQKTELKAISTTSNITAKKADSNLIVAQSHNFVEELDGKRERLGSEGAQFMDRALDEVESNLALL